MSRLYKHTFDIDGVTYHRQSKRRYKFVIVVKKRNFDQIVTNWYRTPWGAQFCGKTIEGYPYQCCPYSPILNDSALDIQYMKEAKEQYPHREIIRFEKIMHGEERYSMHSHCTEHAGKIMRVASYYFIAKKIHPEPNNNHFEVISWHITKILAEKEQIRNKTQKYFDGAISDELLYEELQICEVPESNIVEIV